MYKKKKEEKKEDIEREEGQRLSTTRRDVEQMVASYRAKITRSIRGFTRVVFAEMINDDLVVLHDWSETTLSRVANELSLALNSIVANGDMLRSRATPSDLYLIYIYLCE